MYCQMPILGFVTFEMTFRIKIDVGIHPHYSKFKNKMATKILHLDLAHNEHKNIISVSKITFSGVREFGYRCFRRSLTYSYIIKQWHVKGITTIIVTHEVALAKVLVILSRYISANTILFVLSVIGACYYSSMQ